MQITDVKATLHRIPIEAPLLKERIWTPVVFTTVNTDQGISGYGLTRAAQRHGAKEFINREAAPFLRGKNPVETERIWHELYKTFNPRAQTGMWSSAVSAIDIALWDIKGKYYKEPVWRLLGGAQNPVPAYVTFGLKQYTKDQLAEVAKSFVARGEHRLKMVVAVEPENPSVDAERVRTVREAVGEKVELMIDANYLFSFNRRWSCASSSNRVASPGSRSLCIKTTHIYWPTCAAILRSPSLPGKTRGTVFATAS